MIKRLDRTTPSLALTLQHSTDAKLPVPEPRATLVTSHRFIDFKAGHIKVTITKPSPEC